MNRAVSGLIIICLLFLGGCGFHKNQASQSETAVNTTNSREKILRSYLMDKDFYERAFGTAENNEKIKNVKAGIFPHHLLASYLSADFFSSLANSPSVVVLLTPNHFNRGPANLLSTKTSWDTPYGLLNPEAELLSELEKNKILGFDDSTLSLEHAVSGTVPFIKRTFPQTKILPIIIKNRIYESALDRVVAELSRILPEDSLILASVDFSHDVTSKVAEKQNKESWEAIKNFDYPKIKLIKSDSWPSLYLILKMAELNKAQTVQLLADSNSGKVANKYDLPVTSYLTVYFKK